MKPQIAKHNATQFKVWADGMTQLAKETAAFCKFSALITEADADWQTDDLRPYAEHVINAFGAERVMWGSDWPVCRLRGEYAEWRAASLVLTDGCTDAEQAAIYGDTANRFYNLGM